MSKKAKTVLYRIASIVLFIIFGSIMTWVCLRIGGLIPLSILGLYTIISIAILGSVWEI